MWLYPRFRLLGCLRHGRCQHSGRDQARASLRQAKPSTLLRKHGVRGCVHAVNAAHRPSSFALLAWGGRAKLLKRMRFERANQSAEFRTCWSVWPESDPVLAENLCASQGVALALRSSLRLCGVSTTASNCHPNHRKDAETPFPSSGQSNIACIISGVEASYDMVQWRWQKARSEGGAAIVPEWEIETTSSAFTHHGTMSRYMILLKTVFRLSQTANKHSEAHVCLCPWFGCHKHHG
jgi:hypothetical protein